MERHVDLGTTVGPRLRPDRPRLGLLHHGHGFTQVYVGRAQIQRGPKRRLVLRPLRSHVDRVHELRVAVRLVDQKGPHEGHVCEEILHDSW